MPEQGKLAVCTRVCQMHALVMFHARPLHTGQGGSTTTARRGVGGGGGKSSPCPTARMQGGECRVLTYLPEAHHMPAGGSHNTSTPCPIRHRFPPLHPTCCHGTAAVRTRPIHPPSPPPRTIYLLSKSQQPLCWGRTWRQQQQRSVAGAPSIDSSYSLVQRVVRQGGSRRSLVHHLHLRT